MSSRFAFSSPSNSGNRATIGILIALALGFILCWIPQSGEFLTENFAFWFDLTKPWQFLTFPFITGGSGFGLLFFLFQLMWFYSFGGLLESRNGTTTLLTQFFGGAALSALIGFVASTAIASPLSALAGAWIPISYITVLVCATQPNAQTSFWMIPVQMKWIALLSALFTLFGYGTGSPLFGLALCLPLLFAWFLGQNKIPGLVLGRNPLETKATKKKENREFDEFRSKVRDKEKDRQEKARLRKLLEGSIEDQDPPQAEK